MRRSWMTTIATIAAAVSFGSSAAAANPTRTSSTSSPTTKAGRTSAITGSDIKTTNIDTLAQGGARLEQFYAQPMCTLTVAAVMTGRYPFRYGLQIAIPSAHHMGRADRGARRPEDQDHPRGAKRGTRPSAPTDQRTKSAYIFGAICPPRRQGRVGCGGRAAGVGSLILPRAWATSGPSRPT